MTFPKTHPDVEHSRKYFGSYYLAVNSDKGFKWVEFQQDRIIPALEQIANGQIHRLMIWQHPGSSKTELITKNFIPWWMGKNPRKNAMAISYSAALAANDFGAAIKQRLLYPAHLECFPESQLSRDSRSNSMLKTIKGGTFYAAGFDGSLAGKRCLPAGTMVQTEIGPIDIAVLCRLKTKPLVASHHQGKIVWQKIINAWENWRDDIVEIRTSNGRAVRATSDHPVYTENGYREAGLLRPGERLLGARIQKAYYVQNVWRRENGPRSKLPKLLQPVSRLRSLRESNLLLLQGFISEVASRVRKAVETWRNRLLLLQGAFQRWLLPQVQQTGLCGLWVTDSSGAKILLPGMSDCEEAYAYVRLLPAIFPQERQPESLLRQGVRKFGALGTDDRFWQFPLQGRNELREVVPSHAAVDLRERRIPLPNVSEAGRRESYDVAAARSREVQYSASPYQRKPEGQLSREFSRAMRDVPCDTPQIESDSVASVSRISTEPIRVYDIEVEGAHNFFANEILVHNCDLIAVDDPLKNQEEADSEARENFIVSVYDTVIKNRLRPGGAIIICSNRWSIRDFMARVLEMDGRVEEGGDWTVLSLPAENEDGSFLWEDYFGRKKYIGAKFNRDGSIKDSWFSTYQQEPGQSSEYLFKEDWLQWFDIPIQPGKFNAYILVDPANAKGKKSDFTAIWVVLAGPENKIFVADGVWDRLDPGERCTEFLRLCRRWSPKRIMWEEYGLLNDTYYLTRIMEEQNFKVYPTPVGRDGPRHNLSKHERIKQIVPWFREGRIFLQKKMERKVSTGQTVDLTQRFVDQEFKLYKGPGSIKHEDQLDCLSRIMDIEDQGGFDFAVQKEEMEEDYSDGLAPGQTWQSVY